MDDRLTHFRLGIFVVLLASALMTLVLVYLFGEFPGHGRKVIYVRFDDVTGVTQDTPVRKNGILVGRVRKLQPVDTGVVLTLAIDRQWKVLESEVCRIGNDNLFGDSVLEFVSNGKPSASVREVQDGEYMNGIVASNPLDAMRVVVDMKDEFTHALESIRAAGEEVSGVAVSLDRLVNSNQDQVHRILGQTEKALRRFDTTMVSVNQVVSNEDLQLALEEALEGVPQLMNDAGQLLQSVRRVTDEAERNLLNLRGLTEPLGEQGEEIVTKLNRSVGRIDEMMIQFQRFGEQLNGDGTIGQLVHNPEIYQSLSRAIENIEELSVRLRPIVNDARIAVDKVARNPGILGVQGAIRGRSSGIK